MALIFDLGFGYAGGGGGGSANIMSLDVTPTTSAQTITASGGVDGYSPVNVSAVTSSIDANIVPGNIKKDVQILGVTGNYEGGSSGSKYGANGNTFLGDVNANGVLQPPTEQSDLVFTGVKDVANYALFYKLIRTGVKSVLFPDLTTISGNYGCGYMFSSCTLLTSVSFPALTTIGSSGCSNMFEMCKSLTSVSLPNLTTIGYNGCQYMFSGCTALTSVSFPALTTIDYNGCYNMFSGCTALTSVSLPNLTTISGNSACRDMFDNCPALTSVSFPALTTISGSSACQYMFDTCTALTDVYFPALTTTSFGYYKNQFSNMMGNTGSGVTHTLHFPSNLESTIQGLTGYPLFGGTSGYVVLAFDLPATS